MAPDGQREIEEGGVEEGEDMPIRTIESEGAWPTIDEQTEDVGVEILASAASGQGLDAEAGASQVETAQLQSRVAPSAMVEDVSSVQTHTASKFTRFWISDVVDMLVDDVVDEMMQPPALPSLSFVPPPVAELIEEVATAAVERAVGSTYVDDDPTPPASPQTSDSESSSRPASAGFDPEPTVEADALSARRLEALRQTVAEPSDSCDDLLPPLTLDEIDLDASDERRENAMMIQTMLLEIADGIERIMEKTQAYLSGTSGGWGTDWHTTKGRAGEQEFAKQSRHDSQWHGVGHNVIDDSVGMSPMVTVRQVREHRINSIG